MRENLDRDTLVQCPEREERICDGRRWDAEGEMAKRG